MVVLYWCIGPCSVKITVACRITVCTNMPFSSQIAMTKARRSTQFDACQQVMSIMIKPACKIFCIGMEGGRMYLHKEAVHKEKETQQTETEKHFSESWSLYVGHSVRLAWFRDWECKLTIHL